MTTVAQPIVVVTDWGEHAFGPLAVLIGFIALAGVLYWRMLARGDVFSLPALIALATLGLAAAWCAPVIFSSDVYAYAAYGELARLGLDPYVRVLHAGNDPLIANAAWQWSGSLPVCVYGPAFVALARSIVAATAPLGALAQLQALRLVASAAFLFCAPLAYAAFEGDRRARLRAAATLALNPVAIWCAAEGHNDALALAVVLAGIALVRKRLFPIGAAIVALSALIKPQGAAAAIALGASDRRARAGAAFGLAIVVVLWLPALAAIAKQVAPHGQYAPQASLQAVFAPLGAVPAIAVAAAVSIGLVVGGVRLLRGGRRDGWVFLGLAAWVLIPNPYPWYAIWLVALAAMAAHTKAWRVALLLSFSSVLRYLPDAIATPAPAGSVALGTLAALPLLGLLL